MHGASRVAGFAAENRRGVQQLAKGFTNHEQTDPSGLIYMQARFYAPWFGRFLSPDPALDQHFEHTQSWNIYSYVQNQPTMKIDPTGMVTQDDKKPWMRSAWNAVKNWFNHERHSSDSVTKTSEGGTLTRGKVDVERKAELKGGQATLNLSYQGHDLHNEVKKEGRIGPVFFEGSVTQTKGGVGGEAGAEAGLKGIKASIGANYGPSLGAQGGIGFRVAGLKVTIVGGEAGVQPKVSAEAALVHRDKGGFTLLKARAAAIIKAGLTFVNVEKDKPQ